jgi:hypothetical protein
VRFSKDSVLVRKGKVIVVADIFRSQLEASDEVNHRLVRSLFDNSHPTTVYDRNFADREFEYDRKIVLASLQRN